MYWEDIIRVSKTNKVRVLGDENNEKVKEVFMISMYFFKEERERD